MLHHPRLSALFIMLAACASTQPPVSSTHSSWQDDYGQGGPTRGFTLPFPSGEYWNITQTYESGSHINYNFEYGDDRYAVDFSQSGCSAYGKTVNPIRDGTVLKVVTEGNGDSGYGNSVLVEHGEGLVSRYAHLSEIYVETGDSVSTHTSIGAVGNTGYAVGSACSEHPGTHLHLALYQNKKGVKPEPLSGVSPLKEGCWISREGQMDCSGNPGDYDAVEDEGELSIQMLEHSPSWGRSQETEFVWVAQIEGEGSKPDATLHIYNARDEVTYDFPMETGSQDSPWIFVYQKELRDSGSYRYWVSTSNGDGNDETGTQSLTVDPPSHEAPEILDHWAVPMSYGEIEWRVVFETRETPEDATLNIVNPFHSTIFDFDMDLWHEGDLWAAGYEKELENETVYAYWMTVDNGASINNTPVEWLRVNR